MAHFQFRSDRPIEQSAQDALERGSFARRLADHIHRWDGHESLVIGIHGDWGSGKSSVKNLAIERLNEFEDDAPHVIHFNPWMVSGEQHVAEAFFLELEIVLAAESLGQDGKKRAVAWRKYAKHFETAAKLSNALDVALPFVGALPGIGKGMAERLRDASGLMEHAAGTLEGKVKSFDKQKAEVRECFKQLKRKLVIVIDDLDRLTDEEIRIMFRVVKATTDFPKTVFLLLFQKSTVAKALNPICGGEGDLFLQKIIQVELGLPTMEHKKLAGFWEAGVTEILGKATMEKHLEDESLLNVWFDGLRHYFRNLRDVTRFLNSYGFVASGFCDDGIWEVNPVDLMVIEAIRLFDPEVYQLVAVNKAELTRYQREQHIDKLDDLTQRLLEVRNASLLSEAAFKGLLGDLFPILQAVWRNFSYADSSLLNWTREKRACVEKFFDIYFRFALATGELSEARIAKILALHGDRDALREEIKMAQEDGLLFDILDRLEAEEDFIADPSVAYVLALSDLCDFWERTPKKFIGSLPGSMYAHRAAYRFLRRIRPDKERSNAIVRLIRETQGILIAAEWIIDSTKEKDNSEWPKLNDSTAVALRREWVDRVRKARSELTFTRIKSLACLLRCWAEWSNWEEVHGWLQMQSSDVFVRLLESLASSSTSHSGYHPKTTRWISWKSLESFGSRDFWLSVSQRINSESESHPPHEIAQLLMESTVRWEEGSDDSDSHFFD